jgi:hypothetical protein
VKMCMWIGTETCFRSVRRDKKELVQVLQVT